jgi:alkaline phosphatase
VAGDTGAGRARWPTKRRSEVSAHRRRSARVRNTIIAAVAALAAVVVAIVLLQSRDGRAPTPGDPDARAARNVILLVGDGMGAAHRELGRFSSVGVDEELAMDELSAAGLVHTTSTEPVTDSAAAGTAIATGVKTNNGSVGVDENGREVRSVLDLARQAGKATGLVTTSYITDATPAAFGASVANRDEHTEIARQYATDSGIDLLLGGGRDVWFSEGSEGAFEDSPEADPPEDTRSDQGNLVELAEDNGYAYVDSAEGLASAGDGKLLGLFADQRMYQPASEGDGDEYSPLVSLDDMTRTAIERLSEDDEGFFLMVEEEEAIDEFATLRTPSGPPRRSPHLTKR